MSEEYNTDQIQVLEGLEVVRKRPGMYIGSAPPRGLCHLVYEIVDNSVDEALAGYRSEVEVMAHRDNSVTVKDNRRGIPVDIQKKMGLPAIEIVFTVLHAGGKSGGGGYKVSGGLHGIGASAVNALSTWLKMKVYRNGKCYEEEFAHGKATVPLHVVEEVSIELHGTEVHFLPDPETFEATVYDYETLRAHLRETASLTKNLKITLSDERNNGKEDCFHFEGGIRKFVQCLNRGKEVLYKQIIDCKDKREGVMVKAAMQHNDGFNENIFTLVNNVNTLKGGIHLTGSKNAITKTSNDYARNRKLLKDNEENLSGEDPRGGLMAIASVKVENPQFEGQTKQKLGNSEVVGAVSSVLNEQLTYFLEQSPAVTKQIYDKAILAQRVRAAVKKVRDLTRKKSALDGAVLPGKLADCSSKNPEEHEIFIVEEDSAGGSVKTVRDRKTQAILPLRGKILNVGKARMDRVHSNAETKAMITTFGAGIHEDFDLVKLHHHKIVIMTDAGVDGVHIATLMLAFIYHSTSELIQEGYVYLAQPPLYKLEKGRRIQHTCLDEELNQILQEVGRDNSNKIQRYKGLREMDTEQFQETTMDLERRVLLRVSMDEDACSELGLTFTTLMGDQVEPRREFIESNAKHARNLDIRRNGDHKWNQMYLIRSKRLT